MLENKFDLSYEQIDVLRLIAKYGGHQSDEWSGFLDSEIAALEELLERGLIEFGSYGEIYIINRDIKAWIEDNYDEQTYG